MNKSTLAITSLGLLYLINRGKAKPSIIPPYYTISNENGTIVAKDRSGTIAYSDTIPQTVINNALINSPDNGEVHVSNQLFEVKGINGSIKIPSNKKLVIDGVIRQADNSALRENPIISNSDFINGNRNITLEVNGYIDGNFQNQTFDVDGQTTLYANRPYTVYFNNIEGFNVPRLEVRNPTDWSFRIDNCYNSTVGTFIEHVGVETIPFHQYRDGLHIVDSHHITIDNILGESVDDLFSATARYVGISDVTINNIIGSTVWANGIRIGQTSMELGRTTTIERITIKNAIINNCLKGIFFHCNNTSIIQDISISNFKFMNPGRILSDAIVFGTSYGGIYRRINLKGDICLPTMNGISMDSTSTVKDCIIDTNIYGVQPGYSTVIKNLNESNNIYNITSNPCK